MWEYYKIHISDLALESGEERAACEDKNRSCSTWAQSGYCTRYASYMKDTCPKACGQCRNSGGSQNNSGSSNKSCKDKSRSCASYIKSYQCNGKYAGYMKANCEKSCGFC